MKKKKTILTVCCITYNQEKVIEECIEGILMQRHDFPIQILIHDDASNDGTLSILKEYASKNTVIEIIQQSENQFSKGINPFIEYLIPKIKGKYVAICEGDDYWTDSLKLQKQVDFLKANPQYSMTFHNTSLLQDDKLIQSAFSRVEDRDYSQEELFTNWIVATASMVLKKDVFQQTIFETILKEKHLIFGDNLLVMSSFLGGKVRGMKDNMAVYRKHKEGISYNVDRTLVNKLNKQNILFGKYFPVIKETIPNLITKRFYTHLKLAIRSGNVSDSIYYLRRFCKSKTVKNYRN